jgi:hypothetical protein
VFLTTCCLTADAGLVYRACGLGCPQTCENYRHLREDPSSCDLSEVDGCFCPDNQVSVLCNHVMDFTKIIKSKRLLFLVMLRRGFVHTIFIITLYITDDTDSLFSFY